MKTQVVTVFSILLICLILINPIEARGDTPDRIEILIEKLNKSDVDTQKNAAIELAKIKDPRATRGLITALRSNDFITRKYAAWTLGMVRDVRSIGALRQALGDTNTEVAEQAKAALMAFGKEAEASLLEALEDKNPRVRWRAADLLAQIGNRAGTDSLLEAVEKGSPHDRLEALKNLALFGEKKALKPLINALVDREKDLQKKAPKYLSNWVLADPSIIPQLIKTLKDSKDSNLKVELIAILQGVREPQVTDTLVDLTRHNDARIREAATSALGSTGKKEFLPILIQATKDKDIMVRKSAVYGLGQTGGDEAIEPLIRLLKEEVAEIGPYTATALAKIGSRAVPKILPLLNNKDERIRSTAAKILGDIGSPAAFDGLTALVKDKNQDVRAASISALGRLGDKRACLPLINALKENNPMIREVARFALIDLGDRAVMCLIEAFKRHEPGLKAEEISQILVQIGPSTLSPLEDLWKTGDTESRILALTTIGYMGGGKGIKKLEAALNAKEDVKIRTEAAHILSELGQPAIKLLLLALKDPSPQVRKAAVESLGEIGDPKAIKPLVDMLYNEVRDVKESVLKALGQIGSKDAVKAIISSLSDKDYVIRTQAAEALGNVLENTGDKNTITYLIKLLSDKKAEVRLAAVEALAKIKDSSASESIITLLSSNDVYLRQVAAWALGQLGDKAAVSPLIGSLKDSDQNVREDALLALSFVLQRTKKGEVILADNEIQTLVDFMHNPEESTRIRASFILGLLGPQSIPHLMKVVKSGNKVERLIAISTLGTIGDKRATALLMELFNEDTDIEIKRAVLVPLGKIGDPRATQLLIKQLRSGDWHIRAGAAYALGRIGDIKVVAALVPLLNDEVEKVRKSAGEALEKLTGEKCPILTALSPLEGFYPYIFVIMVAIVITPTIRRRVKPFDKVIQNGADIFSFMKKERVQWWLAFFSGIIALAFFIYCTFIEITESSINKGGDDFYSNFFLFTLRTFPFFVGGCLVSGLIMKYFSRRNVFPKSMAGTITLGSLLPLCSCGVVPLTRAMLTINVPKRAVIAFLIVAPVLNPFVMFLSYGVIGLEYLILRIVAVIILAVGAGVLIERLVPSEEIEENSPICKLCTSCVSPAAGGTSSSGLITGWRLMLYLNRYIIIGLIIGAVIATYVPVVMVSKYLSSNILGLFLAVTIGVPIFLCSGEEIVMLKPLLDMGLPMGHAIAFTIAANGICVSSIAVLLGVLGRKTTILLTISFWAGSFILGFIINMIF